MENIMDTHFDIMPRDLRKALAERKPSEFAILYFITEKTLGYGKVWDKIPLSQYETGTGLDRKTITKGLNALELNGWIRIDKTDQTFSYSLAMSPEVGEKFPRTLKTTGGKIPPNSVEKFPQDRKNSGENFPPQEEIKKEKKRKEEDQVSVSIQDKIEPRSKKNASSPLIVFSGYELRNRAWEPKGRTKTINVQIRNGLKPDKELTAYWMQNNYTELLDYYRTYDRTHEKGPNSAFKVLSSTE